MGLLRRLLGKDIDVLELLASQHREVDQLIEQLEHGSGPRRALLTQLADKLGAHATVEEKLFYPAVMTRETEEMLHEAVAEHLELKRMLADLLEIRLDSEGLEGKLAVLKDQVTRHAHEQEEQDLFSIVRARMSADDRAALGQEVLAMFEELMQGHPSQNVLRETDIAAELPSPR